MVCCLQTFKDQHLRQAECRIIHECIIIPHEEICACMQVGGWVVWHKDQRVNGPNEWMSHLCDLWPLVYRARISMGFITCRKIESIISQKGTTKINRTRLAYFRQSSWLQLLVLLFFVIRISILRIPVMKNNHAKGQESLFHLWRETRGGAFPWLEVNSGCPLVISVTVVALGPWEVRITVSKQLSTTSQYRFRATKESSQVISPSLQRESLLSLYSATVCELITVLQIIMLQNE